MMSAALLCLVIQVSDGDTLTARCNTHAAAGKAEQTIRVRLDGIDAPEHRQPWANQARRALRALVLKKTVELRCRKTDAYQRQICTVWTTPPANPKGARTVDAGLSLLKQGLAWWYQHYAHEQAPAQREQYRQAEQQARRQRTGLWKAAKPVAPWAWRAQQRTTGPQPD